MSRRQSIMVRMLLVFLLIVSIVLFCWNQGRINISASIDAERFANFGTFISAIFSGFAILLLYITYETTLGQLNAARESLRTIQSQVKLAEDHSFENTFFNCLKVHNTITQDLNLRITEEMLDATDKLATKHEQKYSREVKNYFELIYRELHFKYFHEKNEVKDFFKDYRWIIDHYLRSFISIVKLVHEGAISDDKKRLYVGVLRSQSTSEELRLIIYYFINEYDNEDRKQEIKKISQICNEYDFFDTVKDHLIYGKGDGNTDWQKFIEIAK